jgi:hypothetical protein
MKRLSKKVLADQRAALISRSVEYFYIAGCWGADAVRAYLTADHHSWEYEQWEEQQVLRHYYFDYINDDDRGLLWDEIEKATKR